MLKFPVIFNKGEFHQGGNVRILGRNGTTNWQTLSRILTF